MVLVNVSERGHMRKVRLLISTLLLMAVPSVSYSQAPLTRTQIKEAEQRLANLGYWTGSIDGRWEERSQQALIAFQKLEDRSVNGRLTKEELEAIKVATPPQARDFGYEHVEIDLDRQVMLLVKNEGVVRVLPVSSGSGKEFLDDGQVSVAYTPRGRFVVYEKIAGWEQGPIGRMYFPNYISGGVAIHGSRSVPIQPESHGCIRVPLWSAQELSKLMPLGTIVLVYDKISFVSAKAWAENPKLKQSASIE